MISSSITFWRLLDVSLSFNDKFNEEVIYDAPNDDLEL